MRKARINVRSFRIWAIFTTLSKHSVPKHDSCSKSFIVTHYKVELRFYSDNFRSTESDKKRRNLNKQRPFEGQGKKLGKESLLNFASASST